MPELVRDPVGFLEVLDVVPEVGEYGTSYTYNVERRGVGARLLVKPIAGEVSIELNCSEQVTPVLNLRLLGCPAARVAQDKLGSYIEFAGSDAFAGRYDVSSAPAYGFRLRVSPFLQVEPFTYPT